MSPLVINALKGGDKHAHRHMHTHIPTCDKSNFKKPGMFQPMAGVQLV